MEFTNTETVPTTGDYRCTSCGEPQMFEAGDDFVVCDACGDEGAAWEGTRSEAAEEGLEAGDQPPIE